MSGLGGEPKLQGHEQRARERGADAIFVQPEHVLGSRDDQRDREKNADAYEAVERELEVIHAARQRGKHRHRHDEIECHLNETRQGRFVPIQHRGGRADGEIDHHRPEHRPEDETRGAQEQHGNGQDQIDFRDGKLHRTAAGEIVLKRRQRKDQRQRHARTLERQRPKKYRVKCRRDVNHFYLQCVAWRSTSHECSRAFELGQLAPPRAQQPGDRPKHRAKSAADDHRAAERDQPGEAVVLAFVAVEARRRNAG